MQVTISPSAIRAGVGIGTGVLVLTGLVATFRMWKQWNKPEAKRSRKVSTNKQLVEYLAEFFPATGASKRDTIKPSDVKKAMRMTGYTATEVFRKYLHYLIQSREFNTDLVADLVALKEALALTPVDVADALKARAEMYKKKLGFVLVEEEMENLTSVGRRNKLGTSSVFSKLLYLSEYDPLLDQTSEAAQKLSIPTVFECPAWKVDRLRIVSLTDLDSAALERLAASGVASKKSTLASSSFSMSESSVSSSGERGMEEDEGNHQGGTASSSSSQQPSSGNEDTAIDGEGEGEGST